MTKASINDPDISVFFYFKKQIYSLDAFIYCDGYFIIYEANLN